MLRRNGNAIIHFLTQRANLLGFARKPLLAPDTGNSSRNRHKVGWRGQKDLFIECKVPQLRFMLKRSREDLLDFGLIKIPKGAARPIIAGIAIVVVLLVVLAFIALT